MVLVPSSVTFAFQMGKDGQQIAERQDDEAEAAAEADKDEQDDEEISGDIPAYYDGKWYHDGQWHKLKDPDP